MRWSLAELRDLSDRIVPSAIGSACEAGIRSAAAALPARLFSLGCVEARLRPTDDRVDFSVCLAADPGARAAIAAEVKRVDAGWPPGKGWSRCRDLVLDWSDEKSPVFEASNCLWLEFDCRFGESELPQPFGIARLRHPAELARPTPFDARAVAERVATTMLGRELPRHLRRLLEHCHAGLPTGARFLHVAAMPNRHGSPVRLIVSIPIGAIPSYAKQLGWSGNPVALEALTERLEAFPSRTSLHLDLQDRVGPQLGLDLYRPSSPLEDPGWKILFDLLAREHACSDEKRAALSKWPPLAAERKAPSAIGLERELAIKVVVAPGAAIEAKAYLAFGPRVRLL